MPELPEVEDARLDLQEHLQGKRIITCVAADDAKVLEGCTHEEMKAALEGRTVEQVGRKGKNLWVQLSGPGPALLIHLGMDGELLVKGPDGSMLRDFKGREPGARYGSRQPRAAATRLLELKFEDGSGLAFDEWRRAPDDSCEVPYGDASILEAQPPTTRLLVQSGLPGSPSDAPANSFGRLRLVQGDPAKCDAFAKLGFDPLTEMPSLEDFEARLMKRKRSALKAVLLDQAFAAGVGNWVADEILYCARLHPEQPVADLGREHVAALHEAVRSVVATAVAVRADAARYPPGWIFHSRWTSRKDGVVDGRIMKTAGGRTSAYVPELQKLVGGAGKGGTGEAEGDGGGKKPASAGKKAAAPRGGRGKAAAGRGTGKRRRKADTESEEESAESEEESEDESEEKSEEESEESEESEEEAAAPPPRQQQQQRRRQVQEQEREQDGGAGSPTESVSSAEGPLSGAAKSKGRGRARGPAAAAGRGRGRGRAAAAAAAATTEAATRGGAGGGKAGGGGRKRKGGEGAADGDQADGGDTKAEPAARGGRRGRAAGSGGAKRGKA
ncbi:formamidopyrimidine-DNA glycosylase [Monoraphidium neglectum]|uniref:Formamidopyrimidine-DNA glycosylase n=1 Tax=Monoraphidium neglectum TaxID=145388 RepID=A0A0D2JHU8_9CHLO|nr:formamidopyrimidine-DNA glycosylase [Monoraphidium neglectum]KIY98927.1 formamidopyrimidine-DNA glycosylase [Monoraphidium neglectum]|eukprot:XP_013897947.1 formamidopyrimidine-DNA glycosylase [Monoraphidium neglectum]